MKSAAILLLVLTALLGDVFTSQSSLATFGASRMAHLTQPRAAAPLAGL